MALNNVMFDMRRFSKTKNLMDIEDPKKANDAVNKYVTRQVQAAAVGGERVQARVNETLETLRNTIYMGHIKTTDNAQQVARISLLMQQVGEGQLEETAQSTRVLEKTGDAIKNNLPSMDSLIAAVTTANPLVGYGIKMMRDVGRAAFQTRKDRKKVVDNQLKAADQKLREKKREESANLDIGGLDGGMDDFIPQDMKDSVGPKKSVRRTPPDEDRRTPTRNTWLYKYRMSIFEKLNSIESLDESSQSKFEMIGDRTDKNNFYLERIAELMGQDVELTKKLERAQRFSSIEDSREGPVKANESVGSSDGEGKSGSFLDKLTGGRAAMFGGAAGAAFGAAMAKVAALMMAFTRAGARLAGVGLRLGGRAFPLAAAAMTLWDFGKGFINAGEITGKEENNVFDRIRAGRASVFGGLVRIVDDVAGLFGFDLINTENIEQRIYDSIEGMREAVIGRALGLIDSIRSYMPTFDFAEIHKTVTDGVMSIKDAIMDRVRSVWDNIIDAIPSWDDIKGGIKDLFTFGDREQLDYPSHHPMHRPTGSMPSHSVGDEMRNTGPDRGGRGTSVSVNNVDNSSSSSTTVVSGNQRSGNDEPLSRQTFNMPSINLAW